MNTKKKLQIGGVLILIGLAIGGYEYYDFQSVEVPQMDEARRKLEGTIATKQGELKRLQDFARNIETIKLELRELNLQVESALENMPRQFNLSSLLRKLTMLAQNSGLELYTFRPFAGEEKAEGTFYSTLQIEFNLRGSFTQILLFFDQVSRLKRIINAEDLRMVAEGDLKEKNRPVSLNVAARVRTYRFSE